VLEFGFPGKTPACLRSVTAIVALFHFYKLALPDMRLLMLWTGALYEISQGFKAPDKLIASLFEPVLCGVPDH